MQVHIDSNNQLKTYQYMLRDYERRLNVLKEQVMQGIPTDLDEIMSIANGIYGISDFIEECKRIIPE